MATASVNNEIFSKNLANSAEFTSAIPTKSSFLNFREEEEVLSGALLISQKEFKNKNGNSVHLTPVIVDFRRLIQSGSETNVVPEVGD